ncbi:hypothetical protein ES319_A07G073100v1 [Gossypium barbadense]|uniref:Uncharacterized protein n=3 Tax=Gossypium TaxID=3633 RepID=A0A5J5V148_GOSBA|nr:hypothetical protein ES319_A07G073100v1 [Gossypium barbadense]TYH09202.1 hypothetical protein ES288_A07G076700v1 [Gossypium darwinii]TYI18239.1 hypothetical protein ES332_A07G076300v1 [Gossypium tomentosum]
MLKPRGSSLLTLRSSLYFDLGEAEEVSRHIYKGRQRVVEGRRYGAMGLS